MVFQNPDNQFVGSTVEDDVAFGMENHGVPREEMLVRVNAALERVNMQEFKTKEPARLSGGQKQRVAIAGIVALRPDIIILDEATSMLDPKGRLEIIQVVREIKEQYGLTVISITHDLDEASLSDKIIVMRDGKIEQIATPDALFLNHNLVDIGLDVPFSANVARELRQNGLQIPENIIQKASWLTFYGNLFDKVNYTYQPNTPFESRALFDIDLAVADGSFTALVGHTGSGKSTLLQHLNALLLPTSGTVTVGETVIKPDSKAKAIKPVRQKVGVVFQFPETQLFDETVLKDVAFGPQNFGVSKEDAQTIAREKLNLVGISDELFERSPFELSGGQMRRVAIAGILAMNPSVLVLDEPTAGLDPKARIDMMRLFETIHASGVTTILVTHLMDDVADYADTMYVLEKGRIVKSGQPQDLFQDVDFMTAHQLGVPKATRLRYFYERAVSILSTCQLHVRRLLR
jgi:energy-coupling factor transport system ATP-binding protein